MGIGSCSILPPTAKAVRGLYAGSVAEAVVSQLFGSSPARVSRRVNILGNGWVVCALPMILEYLPATHSGRGRIIEILRETSEALRVCGAKTVYSRRYSTSGSGVQGIERDRVDRRWLDERRPRRLAAGRTEVPGTSVESVRGVVDGFGKTPDGARCICRKSPDRRFRYPCCLTPATNSCPRQELVLRHRCRHICGDGSQRLVGTSPWENNRLRKKTYLEQKKLPSTVELEIIFLVNRVKNHRI